jgi:hypothetical protein
VGSSYWRFRVLGCFLRTCFGIVRCIENVRKKPEPPSNTTFSAILSAEKHGRSLEKTSHEKKIRSFMLKISCSEPFSRNTTKTVFCEFKWLLINPKNFFFCRKITNNPNQKVLRVRIVTKYLIDKIWYEMLLIEEWNQIYRYGFTDVYLNKVKRIHINEHWDQYNKSTL